MSKLDELVSELCPEGVKVFELGNIASIKIGEFVKKTKQDPNAPFPVYNGGTTETGFYEAFNSPEDSVVISARGSIGFVNFLSKKFWAGNSCYVIRPKSGDVYAKYLYFALKSSEQQLYQLRAVGGIPALNLGPVRAFPIPLPPLEVQREIVSILDKFTQLEAELEAELQVRSAQLRAFRDDAIQGIVTAYGAYKTRLLDVADIFDGTHSTPSYTQSGIKFVSVENIEDLEASHKFISEQDFRNNFSVSPRRGDVLMTRIGSIGKCAVVETDESLAYYVSLALLRPKEKLVRAQFLKIYLESWTGASELRKRSLLHAVPLKINLGEIRKTELYLPSLKVQDEIIHSLEPLINIVAAKGPGLPSEISARRKQYEYYRNKLLTFKELETA